jgi:hypothetical protein
MRRQCKKCPWRVDVDPHDIPNGYCPVRHANLKNTLADHTDPNSIALALGGKVLRMMACHETMLGKELPCVGWLAHQLGPGNNLALRVHTIHDRSLTDFELVGEQHERFENTLPRSVDASRT